jgi:hypothetical protein
VGPHAATWMYGGGGEKVNLSTQLTDNKSAMHRDLDSTADGRTSGRMCGPTQSNSPSICAVMGGDLRSGTSLIGRNRNVCRPARPLVELDFELPEICAILNGDSTYVVDATVVIRDLAE